MGRVWEVMTANIYFGAHYFWKRERKWKTNKTILLLKCIFETGVFQSVSFTCSVYGFGCVHCGPWMLSGETNVELSACRNNGGASGSHGCRRSNLWEQCQGGLQHHPWTALLLSGAQDRLVAGCSWFAQERASTEVFVLFSSRQDIHLPLSKTLRCHSWENLSRRAEWILANTRLRSLLAAQNPLDFISPPNLHRKWFKNVSPWNQTDKSAFILRLKMSSRHFYFAINKLNHFVSTNTAGSLCFCAMEITKQKE